MDAKDVLKSFGVAGLSRKSPPELYPTLMERIEGFYIAHERGLHLATVMHEPARHVIPEQCASLVALSGKRSVNAHLQRRR
ncbi:hypothetical protein N8H10_17735 [Curtobacterium flaccumfaciens pv. poinsettiae]|nr:hypothetical protein [Curtobacterium flaccumfaciens pv. poinsettiae]